MKKTLLLAMLCAGFSAAPAYAAGPYVSGSLGIGIAGDSSFDGDRFNMDDSMAINAAAGYDFNPVRGEFAIGYENHGYSDHPGWGDLSVTTFMANGYYDLPQVNGFTPYAMAGAGFADVSSEDDYTDETVFAWQLGAGVNVDVKENVKLDLGYRYLRPEGLDSNAGETVNWGMHNIMAGVRYSF